MSIFGTNYLHGLLTINTTLYNSASVICNDIFFPFMSRKEKEKMKKEKKKSQRMENTKLGKYTTLNIQNRRGRPRRLQTLQ